MTPIDSLRFAFARDRERSATFSIVVTVLYVAFLSWAHVYHEPWRDEMHPWIVAKRAQGLWDIATGDRIYDGHPPLWYWYLHVWTWVTHRPWGLHAANVTVMAGVAFLLVRFAPFSRVVKLGLLVSYQLTFEYGIVSRNYGLGLLLVILFCVRFHPLRPRLVQQAVILGLLCLTSVYGLIIAVCLALTLLPYGTTAEVADTGPPALAAFARPRFVAAAGILMAALALCIYMTTPPDPNPASPGWDFSGLTMSSVEAAAKRLTITFFPVRHFDSARYAGNVWAFWGNHEHLLSAVTLGLCVILPVSLIPRWSQAITFLLGTGMMAAVQIARYAGGPRHWGHWLILYLAMCWLSRTAHPRQRYRLSSVVLMVTLVFQCQSFAAAIWRDHFDLFSGARETAAFIERSGWQDLPIVAGPENTVFGVTGHLGRVFVSSESEEVNETMVFHGRRRPFSEATLVARAIEVGRAQGSPVLVVSNRLLPPPADPGVRVELAFQNSQDVANGEKFFVYRAWSDAWRRPE